MIRQFGTPRWSLIICCRNLQRRNQCFNIIEFYNDFNDNLPILNLLCKIAVPCKTSSCWKLEAFSNFSLLRKEESSWKESLTRTSRCVFSLYTGVALPFLFLLQAFTITQLSDGHAKRIEVADASQESQC